MKLGNIVQVNEYVDESYQARLRRVKQFGYVTYKEMDENIMYVDIQFPYDDIIEYDRIRNQVRFKESELTFII